MRYFVRLSYKGTAYFGWQRQPNQISVQEILEDCFSLVLRTNIEVVGCGRTDTGVHAKDYVLHFDSIYPVKEDFVYKCNKILPKDIVIHHIEKVAPESHARFDAISRSYVYYLTTVKDPFLIDTSWYYPYDDVTDWSLVQSAAKILLDYKEFFPFCKSNTDVHTMRCEVRVSHWEQDQSNPAIWCYHIEADRFLRGMIRLIVGMCLSVGRGQMDIDQVHYALQHQQRLSKSLSVPANGLFLRDIRYPYF
jgi:tRNA pseudouridine38-40 synthase